MVINYKLANTVLLRNVRQAERAGRSGMTEKGIPSHGFRQRRTGGMTKRWIPAFAGMTRRGKGLFSSTSSGQTIMYFSTSLRLCSKNKKSAGVQPALSLCHVERGFAQSKY